MLAEEDGRAKNLLYRFHKPQVSAPEPTAGLTAVGGPGRIALHWQPSERARGYVVERRASQSESFEFLATVAGRTGYRDESTGPGQQYEYRVIAVGWGGASAPGPVVQAQADRAEAVALQEDFEGGQSSLPQVQAVPMPEPRLDGGGQFVGRLGHINGLPIRAEVPPGMLHLVIEYDRLFKEPPGVRVHTHYTRQWIRFDTTGEQRHGEHTRFALEDADARKWHKVRIEIPIPEGARRVTAGELTNVAEQPEEGYENPVYIDNLRAYFE
jgi:hypothetical protein